MEIVLSGARCSKNWRSTTDNERKWHPFQRAPRPSLCDKKEHGPRAALYYMYVEFTSGGVKVVYDREHAGDAGPAPA